MRIFNTLTLNCPKGSSLHNMEDIGIQNVNETFNADITCPAESRSATDINITAMDPVCQYSNFTTDLQQSLKQMFK